MNQVFDIPANEHAQKLLNELAMIRREPVRFFVYPERAFLIARETDTDIKTATR